MSALAVKCGLEAVNSQASQRTVRDLVASIRKSAGPEKNKTEAGKVLAAYAHVASIQTCMDVGVEA